MSVPNIRVGTCRSLPLVLGDMRQVLLLPEVGDFHVSPVYFFAQFSKECLPLVVQCPRFKRIKNIILLGEKSRPLNALPMLLSPILNIEFSRTLVQSTVAMICSS